MKTRLKTGKKLIIPALAVLIVLILVTCTSTGEYLPLSEGETVIGTVQDIFEARGTSFVSKNSIDRINTQAYIHLMDAAEKKYPGAIDIRDILWVPGKILFGGNTEISATGKVILKGDN